MGDIRVPAGSSRVEEWERYERAVRMRRPGESYPMPPAATCPLCGAEGNAYDREGYCDECGNAINEEKWRKRDKEIAGAMGRAGFFCGFCGLEFGSWRARHMHESGEHNRQYFASKMNGR